MFGHFHPLLKLLGRCLGLIIVWELQLSMSIVHQAPWDCVMMCTTRFNQDSHMGRMRHTTLPLMHRMQQTPNVFCTCCRGGYSLVMLFSISCMFWFSQLCNTCLVLFLLLILCHVHNLIEF